MRRTLRSFCAPGRSGEENSASAFPENLRALSRCPRSRQELPLRACRVLVLRRKLGRFRRSTGRVRPGKEKENHAFAFEVLQRDLLPFVGSQAEVRRFFSGL